MNERIAVGIRRVLRAGVFVIAGATLAAQTSQLESSRVARGQQLVILVNGPAAAAAARVSLERQGERTPIEDAKYTPPASANARGQISGTVPNTAPLGDHTLTAQVEGTNAVLKQRVSIEPFANADVHLNEFSPRYTYDSEPAWVPGSAAAPQPPVGKKTVRVTLRGTGFIVKPPQENAIWINGARQHVEWDSCQNRELLGSPSAPRPLAIHGEVVSPEEIDLCGIEAPADGELRFAAGFGDTKSETRQFSAFSMTTSDVAWRAGLVALGLALIPLWLLSRARRAYRIAGKSYRYVSALFLDPETDTYSLSKLQFYLWTVAALFGYAFLYISRVVVQHQAWPDVPGTLPAIIGVSAGTAIGAQLVTAAKGTKGSGEEAPTIADLVTSGGVVAVDRVQMLCWTLLGVGTFVSAVVHEGPGTITSLPTVPEKLLYLMGLSSTGYLAGKMARKAGPVIAEISMTPPDSDDGIAAHNATARLPDVAQPIAEARDFVAAVPASMNGRVQAALTALKAAITAAAAARTTANFSGLPATLEAAQKDAEKAAAEAAAAEAATPPGATPAEASTAQLTAAALQRLSTSILQALSAAAATQMETIVAPTLGDRIIDVRGTNLSPDALLQIDQTDLPFRMLVNAQGQHAPDILMRDDTNPTLARVLRFSILRNSLETTDQQQVDRWFRERGHHIFTLTNPDGQKAELSFNVPPGEVQKVGVTS
jgi:hypothetical protein